jgi:hypothetical protein
MRLLVMNKLWRCVRIARPLTADLRGMHVTVRLLRWDQAAKATLRDAVERKDRVISSLEADLKVHEPDLAAAAFFAASL